MVSDVMYSSENPEWGTPRPFFDKVDRIFKFNLDVCADEKNAKTFPFFSEQEDALSVEWDRYFDEETVAWMNPPYGPGEKACKKSCKKKKCVKRGYHIEEDIPGIFDWVSKAAFEALKRNIIVVALLPARTETEWFQQVFSRASLVCFVRSRLKFEGAKYVAPFPSVVAVFSGHELKDEHYEEMTEIGNVIDPREGQVLVYGG